MEKSQANAAKASVHVHVLLQILPVSVCFLANITFVLLQIFFMAFDHMCLQIVRSTKILGTYLTCDHTVCMNLKMPCEVPFLEHISTFVTFDLLMPFAVLVQFGFGHKRFSTLTCMVKHGLDLVKSKIELALNMPKNNSYPIVLSK